MHSLSWLKRVFPFGKFFHSAVSWCLWTEHPTRLYYNALLQSSFLKELIICWSKELVTHWAKEPSPWLGCSLRVNLDLTLLPMETWISNDDGHNHYFLLCKLGSGFAIRQGPNMWGCTLNVVELYTNVKCILTGLSQVCQVTPSPFLITWSPVISGLGGRVKKSEIILFELFLISRSCEIFSRNKYSVTFTLALCK